MARVNRRAFTVEQQTEIVTEFNTLVAGGMNKTNASRKLGVVHPMIVRWAAKLGIAKTTTLPTTGNRVDGVDLDSVTPVEAFAFGLLAHERLQKDLKKGLNVIDNALGRI